MRTRSLLISVVLAAMVALTACGGAGGGPLKVALLFPMSGDVATFGESSKNGVMVAIEEWNAKGGVLGRQIEVVIGDDKCDAQEGANAANKVIFEDGVHYIVGAVCSSSSIPISGTESSTGGGAADSGWPADRPSAVRTLCSTLSRSISPSLCRGRAKAAGSSQGQARASRAGKARL
jgi:hypothetical protein